ncbi:uncharacterized protein IWZ02DRAFT_58180 [Phyllosticta citriasiana]|uniref:uncharacterized protein n=1 Tax=Phyllosticta citriasiana TaxID=595635 RepID=UPI0030FDB4DF
MAAELEVRERCRWPLRRSVPPIRCRLTSAPSSTRQHSTVNQTAPCHHRPTGRDSFAVQHVLSDTTAASINPQSRRRCIKTRSCTSATKAPALAWRFAHGDSLQSHLDPLSPSTSLSSPVPDSTPRLSPTFASPPLDAGILPVPRPGQRLACAERKAPPSRCAGRLHKLRLCPFSPDDDAYIQPPPPAVSSLDHLNILPSPPNTPPNRQPLAFPF